MPKDQYDPGTLDLEEWLMTADDRVGMDISVRLNINRVTEALTITIAKEVRPKEFHHATASISLKELAEAISNFTQKDDERS